MITGVNAVFFNYHIEVEGLDFNKVCVFCTYSKKALHDKTSEIGRRIFFESLF